MESVKVKMNAYIGLGSLQAFIGLGAVAGGYGMVSDPSGNTLGLPMSFLEGSPFPNFLIPGLFLLLVNGIGSLIGAGLSFARRRYAQEMAMVLGGILCLWIVIQVIIIRSFHWMHVLYFILGIVELGIGLYIRQRKLRVP